MMPKQDKAQNLATKRMGKLNQVLEQINQEQAQQIVYKDRRIVELEHAVAMLERVGEERAARIQTLLATVNGHDPYAYMKDVLERLPTHKMSAIGELLKHRWQPRQSIVLA